MNIITFTVSLSEQKFWKKKITDESHNLISSDELKSAIKRVLLDYRFKPEEMVIPPYGIVNKPNLYGISRTDDEIMVTLNIIFNETEEDKDLLIKIVQKANEIGITVQELCSRALKYCYYYLTYTSQQCLKTQAAMITSKENLVNLHVITWHHFRYSKKDSIEDLGEPIILKTNDSIAFNDFTSELESKWLKIADALTEKMTSDKHYRNIFHDFYEFNKNRDEDEMMSGIEFIIKTDDMSPIDIYRRMSCERNWNVVKVKGKLQFWVVKVFFYENKFYGFLDFSLFSNPIKRISNPQTNRK